MKTWYIFRLIHSLFTILDHLITLKISKNAQSKKLAKLALLDYLTIPIINGLYLTVDVQDQNTSDLSWKVKYILIAIMLGCLYLMNCLYLFNERKALRLKWMISVQLIIEAQALSINLKALGFLKSWIAVLTPFEIFIALCLALMIFFISGTNLDQKKSLLLFIGFVNIYTMIQFVLGIENFLEAGENRCCVRNAPLMFLLCCLFGTVAVYKDYKTAHPEAETEESDSLSSEELSDGESIIDDVEINPKKFEKIFSKFLKKVKMKITLKGVVKNIKNLAKFKAFEQCGESYQFKLNEEIRDLKCVICYENEIEAVLDPCGHASFCKECSKIIWRGKRACPLCRVNIDALVFFEKDIENNLKCVGFTKKN
jgi:hypothetical protein